MIHLSHTALQVRSLADVIETNPSLFQRDAVGQLQTERLPISSAVNYIVVQQFMIGHDQYLVEHTAADPKMEARMLGEDETFLHQSETQVDVSNAAMWIWTQDLATPCHIILNETMQDVFSDLHRDLIVFLCCAPATAPLMLLHDLC